MAKYIKRAAVWVQLLWLGALALTRVWWAGVNFRRRVQWVKAEAPASVRWEISLWAMRDCNLRSRYSAPICPGG